MFEGAIYRLQMKIRTTVDHNKIKAPSVVKSCHGCIIFSLSWSRPLTQKSYDNTFPTTVGGAFERLLGDDVWAEQRLCSRSLLNFRP